MGTVSRFRIHHRHRRQSRSSSCLWPSSFIPIVKRSQALKAGGFKRRIHPISESWHAYLDAGPGEYWGFHRMKPKSLELIDCKRLAGGSDVPTSRSIPSLTLLRFRTADLPNPGRSDLLHPTIADLRNVRRTEIRYARTPAHPHLGSPGLQILRRPGDRMIRIPDPPISSRPDLRKFCNPAMRHLGSAGLPHSRTSAAPQRGNSGHPLAGTTELRMNRNSDQEFRPGRR